MKANNYIAAIGERIVRVQAANAHLAAIKAGLVFGSTVREGSDFFDGHGELEIHRVWHNPPCGKLVLRGDIRKWIGWLGCNSSLRPYRLTGAWQEARERFGLKVV